MISKLYDTPIGIKLTTVWPGTTRIGRVVVAKVSAICICFPLPNFRLKKGAHPHLVYIKSGVVEYTLNQLCPPIYLILIQNTSRIYITQLHFTIQKIPNIPICMAFFEIITLIRSHFTKYFHSKIMCMQKILHILSSCSENQQDQVKIRKVSSH